MSDHAEKVKRESLMKSKISKIKKLEELLAPDSSLQRDIYNAAAKIHDDKSKSPWIPDELAEELDNALNRYLRYAIEYDRLKRDVRRARLAKAKNRRVASGWLDDLRELAKNRDWTAHTRKSNRERLDRIADGIEEEMRLAEQGGRYGRY